MSISSDSSSSRSYLNAIISAHGGEERIDPATLLALQTLHKQYGDAGLQSLAGRISMDLTSRSPLGPAVEALQKSAVQPIKLIGQLEALGSRAKTGKIIEDICNLLHQISLIEELPLMPKSLSRLFSAMDTFSEEEIDIDTGQLILQYALTLMGDDNTQTKGAQFFSTLCSFIPLATFRSWMGGCNKRQKADFIRQMGYARLYALTNKNRPLLDCFDEATKREIQKKSGAARHYGTFDGIEKT